MLRLLHTTVWNIFHCILLHILFLNPVGSKQCNVCSMQYSFLWTSPLSKARHVVESRRRFSAERRYVRTAVLHQHRRFELICLLSMNKSLWMNAGASVRANEGAIEGDKVKMTAIERRERDLWVNHNMRGRSG